MSAQKGHPRLSSDDLLPRSEKFQLSFDQARLGKTSPKISTEETKIKHTIKALKSDSLKSLPKLSAFTQLSFPNDPLFQLLTAPPAITVESLSYLSLSSAYYKTPFLESMAPYHFLKSLSISRIFSGKTQ